MVLQSLYEYGVAWHYCCWVFASASSLMIMFTPLIPRHHIPYTEHKEKEDPLNDTEDDPLHHDHDDHQKQQQQPQQQHHEQKRPHPSLRSSVVSLSSLLHSYWLFINLFGVTLFATHFNAWINKFATSTEETSYYSKLYGYANILCVFYTPIPGIIIDVLSRRFKRGKTGLRAEVASLQAMIIPMMMVSVTVFTQTTMLLFRSPWAVYVGLVALTINRPSCLAVGNPFVRARFPAEHFNRVIGIQGTALSVLTFLQYPHFTWAQDYYYLTFGVTLGVMSISLSHPLHLLSKRYLGRVLMSYTPEEAL
ncbi:hypothetical protein Pmani_013914 [Petrolisthes manimaculis]|uniref:Uncharacterized protein n=1 Tax=Petrolisthes manimaculis TaxID=1843537 RepID=A0AAE1PV72_9EUCA|nr:hypothetical protein Pmani_013914 [Petrolisthes manimaculis]